MYALIMAGGRGTRFWPRSRDKKPKHLLDIVTDRTIIQETVDRIKPLIPARNIIIVTGKTHARELIRQLPEIPVENILIEPMGRNTAACIGYAAVHIQKRAQDAVMVVLPSDHGIGNPDLYRKVIAAAAAAAQKKNALVTIGLKPESPHTGFGYMEGGAAAGRVEGMKVLQVRSFREKPGLRQARAFLEKGNFYWNSGMFVWRADTVLEQLRKHLPQSLDGVMQIARAWSGGRRNAMLDRIYPALPKISVDYAVLEKAARVLVVEMDCSWVDVGSWAALESVIPPDAHGNVSAAPRVVHLDSRRTITAGEEEHLIATLGVDDLIVVHTPDATLVAHRSQAQRLKELVAAIQARFDATYS